MSDNHSEGSIDEAIHNLHESLEQRARDVAEKTETKLDDLTVAFIFNTVLTEEKVLQLVAKGINLAAASISLEEIE